MKLIFSSSAIAVAATLVLTACGSEASHQTAPSVSAPLELVRSSVVPEERITSGTVRAAVVSPLSAKVMGNVVRVLVAEGDRVRAGQLLLEIDGRDVRAASDRARAGEREIESALGGADAAISAAEANANVAEATFKRFSALRERGSISPQEFDEAQARYRGATAELERARRGRAQLLASRQGAQAAATQAATYVDYTRITAPVDGVITARMVDPGAQAAPGMPLLTIESSGKYRVETTVDESALVRPGDPVTVVAGDQRIEAQVTQVVPSLNPMTRSAIVKIDLPANAALRSGSYVNVAFTSGKRSAITVPASAVSNRGQLTSVYVVDRDGKARLRLVTLGDPAGDRVEILSGVEEGERVLRTITPDIRDGVQIANAGASKERA